MPPVGGSACVFLTAAAIFTPLPIPSGAGRYPPVSATFTSTRASGTPTPRPTLSSSWSGPELETRDSRKAYTGILVGIIGGMALIFIVLVILLLVFVRHGRRKYSLEPESLPVYPTPPVSNVVLGQCPDRRHIIPYASNILLNPLNLSQTRNTSTASPELRETYGTHVLDNGRDTVLKISRATSFTKPPCHPMSSCVSTETVSRVSGSGAETLTSPIPPCPLPTKPLVMAPPPTVPRTPTDIEHDVDIGALRPLLPPMYNPKWRIANRSSDTVEVIDRSG